MTSTDVPQSSGTQSSGTQNSGTRNSAAQDGSTRGGVTRIPFLPLVEHHGFGRELLENKTFPGPDGEPYNHYRILARSPWFFDRWLKMTGTVLKHSSLDERTKAMVIMHVAWWTRCSFAWVNRDKETDQRHNLIPAMHSSPKAAGCTAEELADLARPAAEGTWSAPDRAVLDAIEETGRDGGISTPTWRLLAARFTEQQLFDLVALIGLYLLTCTTINSLGVPGYPGDAAPPWAPVDNGSPR